MEDKLLGLYNDFKNAGLFKDTKDYGTFRQRMQGQGYQAQIYKVAKQNGADVGQFWQFQRNFGLGRWAGGSRQPVQPTKPLTTAQRANMIAQEYKKKLQQKSGAYKEGANFVQANGYEGESLGDLIGDAWEGVKSVGRKVGDYFDNIGQGIKTTTSSGVAPTRQIDPTFGTKPSASTNQVVKNWELLQKKNSQMTPLERSQAAHVRSGMQNANAFSGKLQQFNTPEARIARAKQQHEDDINQMAYQGVGQNLGKDIFAMTDKAIDLAEQSSKDFFKGAEDALGFSQQYDPRIQKSIADAADMRKSTETIQQGLQVGLADKVQEYFSRPEIQKNVMDTAEKMNISLEEAVQKYYMPNLMQYAKDAVEQRQLEKVLPQGFFDYLGKNLSNTVIGMIASNALYSKEERQRRQRALAISEGIEEAPRMVGHNTDYYKAGVLSRAAGTGVNMLADSPIFGAGGTAADMAVNTGSRILARGLEKVGLKAIGKVLTPREMAFKAANMSMAQKMMSGLTTGTAKSALNLGGYSSITGGLQQISTGEDSSPAAVAMAAITSGWHGAKTGAMFGFSGGVMHPWASRYGITGLERNAEQRFIHGAQKVGATAASVGVEAGTMMVADHLQDDKEMSFAQWLEDGVTVMAFKLGEPRNYKHVGSILHGLTHNTSKTPITLTKDEKSELINSVSGKNLMDAFVKVDRASNTAPRDPMYKTAYTDFMKDPEVSRSTKEKVNAALGMPSQNYKISQRSVNDVKNKQILEYASDGTLLTRTSYKNAEERRDILYRQKADRDNMYVLNLVGIAKLRGRQLVDDNGKVSRVAADFLQDKGYDISKDPTDPKNAELIANLQNPNHELYLDWIKYADERNQFTGVDTSINKILEKQPLKRTDEEVTKLKEYAKSLETQLFPDNKLHTEESRNQGRRAAEDNNLGTEQPNGEAVKQGLDGLRQAENNFEAAYESNDVLKIGLNKLAEDMGAKPKTDGLVDVLNALQEKGLTNPQIYGILADPSGKYIVSEEQLTPFAQYMHANEMIQGMQEATKEAIDENVNTRTDQWSLHGTMNGNKMDGEQVLYVKDSEGRTLIVGSGEVAFDPTSGRAKEGVGDMLVCLDTNTREAVWIKADEVTFAGTQSVEDFKNAERLRLQMINSQPYNEAAQEQAILNASKPQQEQEAPKDSTTNGGDLTKDNTTLTKVDTTSGKDNTTNENLVPQEQPQQESEGMKLEDGTPVPFDANGEPDFLKMTPEQGAEVYKMLFEEDAPMQIDSDIKTLEKDLEKVKASKYEGASVIERAAARRKVKEAIALAEAQVEKAKAIKAAMEKKPENTGVGTVENAGQYEKERQQGYREGEGGVVYHRQKPEDVGGVRGKEVTVAFSPTEKVAGHVKLVELDTVQASHNNGQLNLLHFGPDWQPKDRSSQASRVEAEKIAGNIDPEQITGSNNAFIGSAPSVNERHETIQGNNRVDALKEMYASHPDQAAKYKQWLIDHAAEFGLNAEDIKKMKKPVIVNELPVDDAAAKKLGQMMASGFESGGKRIPEVSATINKLGDKMENLANVLLAEGTLGEDAKLSDLINQNSKRALEYLNKNGFIDNTEYENLATDVVTRRQWLENVLKANLFDGNRKTEAAFNRLPGNAQKAVLATFMRDRNSKAEDRIKENIQKSFEAYNELNQIAGFKNAKNIEQARAAIQAELLNGSNNVFGEASIREKYTNFELELAALYKGLKDQKSLTGLFGEFYDAVQGKVGKELDAFSQVNAEPLSKDEAIEKVFGINNKQDYDRRRETESPSESGGGNGAEPAGDRAAGSEPEPVGEEPDDLVNKELVKRITETDEEFEVEGKYGTIYKKKYLIDGDKEVMKVDEPNKDGDYTGSYYEFDGKKYGDLTGVLEQIDGNAKAEEMPEGPIYDRKKALIDEIEKGGIKKKDDAFQLLYKAEDLLDDYLGIPHDEWKPEPSRSNTIAGILSMARNALDRIKNEPVEPATEKQLSYLERLTSDDPTTRKLLEGVKLNKKQATWLIGNIKGLDDNLMRLHPDDIAETEKFIHDGIEYMKKLNSETSNEGGLPLLPKEEKPDPTFDPIAAAVKEFKKEHPLTEEEIMKADVDDVVKDMALDYLNGDVTDDLHRAIYESIYAKRKGLKAEPKVETPKAEPSADPMEGIKNAAEGFEKEKKTKAETEKKPQQTADDAAVAASNKKVNDLWDMLKNAGKDETSASFIGLNSRQLEVLPKLVSAMAENAYLRIKRGMHNLEDVVKEMRKEFAPAAKVFKKEDVDAIYEQMMNIRYRDGEQRMSLKEWADYYEKTSPKHQENLVGDSKDAEERKMAEKKFIDTVNIKLGFKHKFNGIVELRQIAEKVGLKDIKDTDLQELAETAIVKRARGIASSDATDNAEKFKRIKTLYENQPSLNQRDSERVMKGQFSTPAPYAFLADMYVKGNGKVIESALEPSAGNGMLTIGLPMDKVHVNDIDDTRLLNLNRQGFGKVTSQDGTQPFNVKPVDIVITNPPFGSATPRDYDGYKISSLEGQMAINALDSMKGDGRAAIIIGGNTEYAKNGSLRPKDKAFLGYLYSHYNVEDVINVDGSLFAKQGTTFPTRMILINGRRLNENAFPPVKDKARAETVKDYDELYKRIEDDILRGERMDSSIGGERGKVNSEPDKQGSAGAPEERVRARERGGSEPDGKRESDVSDTSSVSGTHDDLDNQRGTEPRKDGGLPDGDTGADRTGADVARSEGTGNNSNSEGRVLESGGNGRSNAQPNADGASESGSGGGSRRQLQRMDQPVRGLSTEKVTYTPKSENPFTLKSVMPADQQEAVNKNLEKLGDADQFLVDELGYNDKDDLYSHLAAEQVDSVALALQQAKKGNAFIVGDQTGIGKGRQAASFIRYAVKNGQIPVYFTQKAHLLSDVYRDLVDIGSLELRPFILGSKKEATVTDSDGNVVYPKPSDAERDRVLAYIEKNGKLPKEYDYVLTTYSQVGNGVYEFDENGARKEKKLAKGKTFGAAALSGQRRRDAIEKLMDNAYLILDESHTAGGNSGQGNYFQHIIQKAKNVTFFSATFAKRPDNMPIYALRTAMNEGGMKSSDLIDAVKRGGATLQEIMSQTLTQCGQMIRRERDMTGVTIDWKAIDDPERVKEQREQYDSIIGLFNDIINFQKKYVSGYVDKRNEELAEIQSTIGIKQGTAALGIKNQPFASKAFNTVQQVLLSLKAKSAAERAIDYLKQGMKPVIALNNTNESQTGNLALGEEMDAPDLGTSLKKGLEGTLRYTQKDAKDNSESGYIKLEDLGDEAIEAYQELEKKIEQTSTGLSLSPIDVIKNELQKAGYKVGELTGRQTEFVYNENGTVTKIKRADTDKKKLARDFNDGKIDALILNKSAATGISLHASSKYKDQKKRVMIVAQQQLDVNDEVQMRGRIDRTGQVARGAYEYVVSLIPAEQRLLMMFKAKLKSLDANTTSSQKSKFNEMEVADITNKYGDKVVKEYMAEHLDLYARMADPFGWEKSLGEDLSRIDPQRLVAEGGGVGDGEAGADASKLLGRMALLRVSEQEKMLQEIGELYANEIQRLNEMGENDLEITELPLKAKTIRKEVWKQGAEPGGDNAFADNTYIEKVNMAILKKPMKAAEVKASQEGLTGGKTWEEYKAEKKTAVKEYFDQKIADETQRYEERAVKAATKAKEKYIKDAKKGQKDSGMSDEQIEKMAGYQYDNIYKQEKDKLNDVAKNLKAKAEMFDRVLDTFDTNSAFVLPADMNNPNELSGFGNSYGRLIDIKITDNFSPNASSVSFATLDGRRKITFPIAGKVGVGDNKADVISAIDNMTKQAAGMGDSHLRVLNQKFDNWDRLTSNESRKDGYIVTGNLMQALVDSKDQGLGGQLVKYTTDTGEVKTGILMPDRFDPKGLNTDAPINSVADKFELSSWHGGIDEVTSSDGEVKVKRIDNNRGNFYELRVPKSKAKGGKYFLDNDLLKLVNGKNFETRGNNMLAEFKPEQLKPVLDRLSKMGVKVQEERKTSEDEGTHFREDRGLQYSKTDTKDVKNSRIIPEDVDKTVSSQIEKKFDDEINRLFTHVTPNIRRWANAAIDLYSKDQTLNSWEVDENKNVTLSEGLNTVIDDLTKKINEYETKYGIRKDANIGELVNSILRKINSEGSGSGRNTSDKGQQEGTGGEAKTLPGGGGERRALDVLNDYKALSIRKAAAERAKAYILARSKSLQETYGLKKNEPVSYETIDRIFNDYNSDPEIKELYDSIVNSLRSLGTEFYVGSIELARTKGYYKHSENFIKLNVDRLSAAGYTKQNLASTLCHEMLHPLTSDIIAMYQKGHTDKLSPSQIEAAKDAVDIYNELIKMQKDGKIGDYYGLENPREMITELASPEWRSALRKIPAAKKWYQKLINAICRMIGKDPKYNKLGEMERTLTKLLDNFGKEQFDFASQNENELFGREPQGSKVTDPKEIKRLEEEPKIKVYRAMQVIDGKLYPPMAAYADGKLVEANELGKWIKADEMPDSKNTVYKYKGTTTTIPKDRAVKGEDGIWRDSKNGAELAVGEDGNPTWYFKLQKGKGATGKKLTDVPAAYNPYWHTSYSPLNDQFKSAWIRPNVVVVECEVPAGELTSGYRAEHAKDSVGMTPWTSGVVTKQLVAKGHEGRKVMLSRWCKPVRIVPDEEVAAKIKDFIGDYDVEIPENVVTPRQKVELEKLGVKIGAPEKGMNKNEQIAEAIKLGLQVDNTVLSEDGTKFREDHGDGNYPASSVESHVKKVAQKTGGKVKMVSSVDEITNKAARAAIEDGRKITGWYDEKTGEVRLYMPNIHDRYTAEKTIWHEVVGHKGMRELFGDERFDKFLREVWYDLDKPENAALKKLVDEERKFNPLNIYDAIEEGIARLAEDGKGEPGFWNGIKNKVSDFLHEIGYRIAPNTKDVKYLLWLSKNLQKNPNDPYWKMRAEAVKYRLDHERMPAVVAHDGMFYGNDGKVRSMDSLTKSEWDEATDGQIHFRTTPSAGTALDRYHRSLDEHGYMLTESYMDNMLSLKKLMNAIVPDKKIEDIASSENPYMLQNTMQGAMSNAAQMFERNVMKPLDKAMADVLDAFDGKKDDEKIRNFNLYMITKHGLERNREFFVRDFLKQMRMDEQKKQDADFLENSYYSDKEYLDNELKAGNIDLKECYRQLDESIRNHFDADFEAGEHDYSGIHAIQEVAKSSDPYDDAEAIQSVMDSEAKMESIKKGAVKDYWDKVKAATQYSIDSDYKNGIISRELHGHVSNMFNWYVPLRKYDEATAEDTYGYITEQGDPKSYIGSTIMRARGHKYLSETNVLAQIGAMGNRAIKNGGMNAIRQAFARFARNNSGNNLITETSVWYEKDPVVNIVYERYPDIPEGATADEINHIVSDFNKDMKMKESQGLAYKVYRRDKIGYKFQRAENKSQHIVDVKIAGRTHTFIINGNPRAAQALNGLLEHKNDTLAGRVTASISRKMAQLCTSYNPEFVMRNMIKDLEFASTNLLAKEGLVYTKRFEQYYAKVGIIEGIRNSKLKDFADTGGFGLYAKYRNGTLDTTNKLHRYFKEFMENGGETGWVQIKNMEDFTKEYKAHVKTERNKIQKVGMGIYDAIFTNLENINEIAENLARFATYCASRDSNRSVIRSVYDAKEVSTNFNRHGSGNAIYSFKNGEMGTGKTARKNIYGFTAAWFRNSSMFFNAGIQSTNLLVKNFKNNKAGTIGYIASAPFISGMAMALLNNFIISNEDEKDRKGVKDPYAELPDYIRRNNLCVYIGGGEFVTIPLAIEERAFYGLGDFAAGMTFSKNISSQKMPNLTENKDIDKYLNPFMDAVGCMSQLVPVADYLGNASFGKHPVQETIKAVAPSATSPFLEWVYNSDWKGAPIQRDNKFDENQPSWMLAYKGTPEWMINMNKKVNALTNDVAPGNEDMKGNDFLDEVTNPSALHHFYGSYFGGAATFVERVGGLIKNGKDTETKDIPFLRSLLYTPNEQSSLQRTKSKWYNYKDEMEKTMANVDRLKSKNVPLDKRITNIGEYYQFQNSKEAAKVRVIELAEKQMERWKKMKGKASDTESINFANQNIDRIMMDAVDELDRLE